MREQTSFSPENLARLDQWIRQGQVRPARQWLEEHLQSQDINNLPRTALAQVAALCRRAGAPQWSLRLLNSWVRPRAREPRQASAAELAEYGAALLSIGAIMEARAVLQKVPFADCPEGELYLAFTYFHTWEYQKSLPFLTRYLARVAKDAYLSQVAQINWAAALIAVQDYSQASAILEQQLGELEKQGSQLLLGNAWTLLAQCRIHQREWAQADLALRYSEDRIGRVPGFDGLIIAKWRAVWKLKQEVPGGVAGLRAVRAQAVAAGSWETMRDCDFHEARASSDARLWERLYFGTPYPAFRAKIAAECGADLAIRFASQKEYIWSWQREGKPKRIIDSRAPFGLKCGQVQHRLLIALLEDFYRPLRLANLHEAVFPGRYFNPDSSPAVIHQAMRRLRTWLRRELIPLEVIEKKQDYSLLPLQETVGVIVSVRNSEDDLRISANLSQLAAQLGDGFIVSRTQAAKILGISSRSAYSILAAGADRGLLEVIGSGPSTRYRRLLP